MNPDNLGYFNLLLDPHFIVMVFTGVAAFATVLTLGVPYMKGNELAKRMKYVAVRRDELRARSRLERFAQAIRSTDATAANNT